MHAMAPAIFVSHGAPTMYLEPTPTHEFLVALGKALDRPRAILCISAHWEAANPTTSASPHPDTIHDFGGFPDELYRVRYAAPGDPALAERVAQLLGSAMLLAGTNVTRGLDHGAWVPLALMYPQADVPIVQLSVQTRLGATHHLMLGRALRPLREEGVMILGSGGATHNLYEVDAEIDAPPADYALAFDAWLTQAVTEGREEALVNYLNEGPSAHRNHPTAEHLLPLFVPLGTASAGARGRVLHKAFHYGTLSMAALAWD